MGAQAISCSLGQPSRTGGGHPSLPERRVDRVNGCLLWVWEVHMHSLTPRWDPANSFGFPAIWQRDWALPEEIQGAEGRPGALALRASSIFHVWGIWAKLGQTGWPLTIYFTVFCQKLWFFFPSETLAFVWGISNAHVCVLALLVLGVFFHGKEQAEALSSSHSTYLILRPCILLKPPAISSVSLLHDGNDFPGLSHGIFMSTDWVLLFSLGKASLVSMNLEVEEFIKIRELASNCLLLQLPTGPGRRLEYLSAASKEGEWQIPFSCQSHAELPAMVEGPIETFMPKARLVLPLACRRSLFLIRAWQSRVISPTW